MRPLHDFRIILPAVGDWAERDVLVKTLVGMNGAIREGGAGRLVLDSGSAPTSFAHHQDSLVAVAAELASGSTQLPWRAEVDAR